MTNDTQNCLSAEVLEQIERDEIAPADLATMEQHITECDHCRALFDMACAAPAWCDEIRPALLSESGHSLSDDEEHNYDVCLQSLGPSDDPHMLGRIGSYEVTSIIGRGGMGVVFKAFDLSLDRFVAIKMLSHDLAASGAGRQRFMREGKAAAAVIDDHVLPVYGVDQWQGLPYLVMQYSRGESLQQRLRREGPLALNEILRIGLQTARGLAAAHAQGLVHRDVKPSNILLSDTVERAVLSDFGLARAVDDASMTRSGMLAGTPQYMSPEQARAEKIDQRSDLFSLGSVLYAMCAGHPPFRAESSYSVMRLITDHDPRPIQQINPDIPDWLCLLITRLMAKRPDDRFNSAEEVANLLEACLAHVQRPTDAALPEELVSQSNSHKPRWPTTLAVGLGTCLLLFALVFVVIETNKGTIRIESEADDIPIVLKRSGRVYDKLTISRRGESVRVYAGEYEVSFDGRFDQFAMDQRVISIGRGDDTLVRIVRQVDEPVAQPADVPKALDEVRNTLSTGRIPFRVNAPQRRVSATLQPVSGAKWRQVKRVVLGKVMPDRSDAFMIVTPKGLIQHHVPGDEPSKTTIVHQSFVRFSWQEELAEVDKSQHEDWSRITRGIVKLTGDYLTLCFAKKGEPRPTIFATGDDEGAGHILYEFRRVPDAPAAPSTASVSVSETTAKPGAMLHRNVGGITFKFRYCPAGDFMMGSSEHAKEGYGESYVPSRRVTIAQGFWTQQTEVTQSQYEKIMGQNPSFFRGAIHSVDPIFQRKDTTNNPVERVSWYDAKAFCEQLSRLDPDYNYRLPTEREWEYACRAGTTKPRYGVVEEIAWVFENTDGGSGSLGTMPVGMLQPNAWGLHDTLGNVSEWCQDRASVVGASDNSRAIRGDDCYSDAGSRRTDGHVMAGTKRFGQADSKSRTRGFRVVAESLVSASSPIRPQDESVLRTYQVGSYISSAVFQLDTPITDTPAKSSELTEAVHVAANRLIDVVRDSCGEPNSIHFLPEQMQLLVRDSLAGHQRIFELFETLQVDCQQQRIEVELLDISDEFSGEEHEREIAKALGADTVKPELVEKLRVWCNVGERGVAQKVTLVPGRPHTLTWYNVALTLTTRVIADGQIQLRVDQPVLEGTNKDSDVVKKYGAKFYSTLRIVDGKGTAALVSPPGSDNFAWLIVPKVRRVSVEKSSRTGE